MYVIKWETFVLENREGPKSGSQKYIHFRTAYSNILYIGHDTFVQYIYNANTQCKHANLYKTLHSLNAHC